MRRLLALFLLLAAGAAWAETLTGVVVVVIDGDTLLFKPDRYLPAARAFLKVRLVDIDAPEKGQPYGEAATRALEGMALQQRATLEVVATDVYGRRLGRLEVGALPVNEELVRRGYAWSSSRNPRRAMRPLQDEARRAGIGLWQDPAPIPPWVWRRAQPARGR